MESTRVGSVHVCYFLWLWLNYSVLRLESLGHLDVRLGLDSIPTANAALRHVQWTIVVGANCYAPLTSPIDLLQQYLLLLRLHLHPIQSINRDIFNLFEVVEAFSKEALVETLELDVLQKLVHLLIMSLLRTTSTFLNVLLDLKCPARSE